MDVLIPLQDFEVVKIEEVYYIKMVKTGELSVADNFAVFLWLERERLIERILKLGST